ncbi:methionyl-tRNA formyltransferase [Serpentinimonas barnesii]|uniref:methionyl-tRNA formyltransferase n=1 Tax=Serpentinimonas barnesii TaxID=1458427 RepID=UPI0004960D14|nr:methionyl-tRNA formyltransferase [Serpentinimonas barnesii]
MRVVFAGTPEFAALALRALLAAGHDVALVLTQPDRPAGRGLKPQPSAVKQVALQHGLALAQPRSLRLDGKYPDDAAQARAALQQADADVAVVAAYGLLLPPWVLALPRLGCLNIHASLLPRWRGAAPIQRALEAGDAESGITIMQMDAGLDTGPMLLRQALPIAPHETAASLHDRLAQLGAHLIVQALQQAEAGQSGALQPQPQPEQGVTYAAKIDKAEALIDWRASAEQIGRRVRAFDPVPGAVTLCRGEPLKVWAARAWPEPERVPGQMASAVAPAPSCGTVLAADAHGVRVQTGDGVLLLTELQRPGGKRLPAAAFLAGHALPVGTVLGDPGPDTPPVH